MPSTDHAGNPVSRGEPETLMAYARALHQFHCYHGDPVATIDQALAASPDFVMGRILHGWLHALGTEPAAESAVREDIALATAAGPNDRERAHLDALTQFVDGRWRQAGRTLEDLGIAWPRDALALQAGHLIDFYRGDARMLRDRIARALPAWAPGEAGYHALLGMLAFGREECGDYAGAERAGRRALELEPLDAWAQHAVAHAFEMQGRAREGVAWMRSREPHWAEDNFFAVHNWWHLAVFHLDLGEQDAALEIFDGPIHGTRSSVLLDLIDASALLWRLELLGAPVGTRWQSLATCWEKALVPGEYSFNDLHAMLAWLGAGRMQDARALVEAQRRAARDARGDHAALAADIGIPLLSALLAHREGGHEQAAELLRGLRPIVHRFGGSHAQRDLIDITLVDAATRASSHALARALIDERRLLKPDSAINRTMAARLPGAEAAEAAAMVATAPALH